MLHSEALSTSSRWRNTVLTQNFRCSDQASRLIVTFDEHVISNNFKFGVIYQKFGQVSEVPMISLLGDLKSGSSSKKYVNFFLLLPPCRLQKKNCLGTWKKVPPLLSSWSFWVTGLTFMTLKGLVAVHLFFSFLLNLYQSTPSHTLSHLAIDRTELQMDHFRKKKKNFGMSWYLWRNGQSDWSSRQNALVSPQKMDEGRSTGCSENPSSPNAALLSSTQWLISVAPFGCTVRLSLLLLFWPSVSPFFFLLLQVSGRPGCHSWADGDRICLHKFP